MTCKRSKIAFLAAQLGCLLEINERVPPSSCRRNGDQDPAKLVFTFVRLYILSLREENLIPIIRDQAKRGYSSGRYKGTDATFGKITFLSHSYTLSTQTNLSKYFSQGFSTINHFSPLETSNAGRWNDRIAAIVNTSRHWFWSYNFWDKISSFISKDIFF